MSCALQPEGCNVCCSQSGAAGCQRGFWDSAHGSGDGGLELSGSEVHDA